MTATDPARQPVEAREFFQSSVDDYDALHYGAGTRSLMTVRLQRMLEAIDRLGLPPGARVLEAGCGPGHLAEALAARGLEVWALDASRSMLQLTDKRLRRRDPASNPRLMLGSIEQLPVPAASFDLVCSAGVIEYLVNDDQVMAEFRRALRPGAHLVLPFTNYWSIAGYLDFAVEALKRQPWFLAPVNAIIRRIGGVQVRPRHFRVRRHRPAEARRNLASAGLALRDSFYFHFLPWPHPFDRLFPRATAWLGGRMEGMDRSPLGPLGGEGYLTISTAGPPARSD